MDDRPGRAGDNRQLSSQREAAFFPKCEPVVGLFAFSVKEFAKSKVLAVTLSNPQRIG
jgi:hypothetical protein